MKVLAIGDPHGDLKKIKRIPIKNVDLILLTGDLGSADSMRKMAFKNIERKKKGLKKIEETSNRIRQMHMEIHNSTVNVLKYLSKYAPVYTIQGNVGLFTDSEAKEKIKKFGLKFPSTIKDIRKMGNVYLVKNRLKIINGLRIGFLEYFVDTNWVKDFKPSDYNKRMIKAKKQTEKAKKILNRFGKTDILVCHQPPYGFLDKVTFKQAPKHWRGKHAGSRTILNYIKKKQPKYVFCGHIHEGKGKKMIGKTEVYNLGVGGHKIVEF